MPTNNVKLFCWVLGDECSFGVDIYTDRTVDDLLIAIAEKDTHQFQPLHQLELCIANIPDTKTARKEFVFQHDDLPGSDTIQAIIDHHFQGKLPQRSIYTVLKPPRK